MQRFRDKPHVYRRIVQRAFPCRTTGRGLGKVVQRPALRQPLPKASMASMVVMRAGLGLVAGTGCRSMHGD
ncbi:hypothetical protein CAOG_009348 [Capsaspora owczarzaki ATCC 30864]|uniref:Uncharacterized protein n=1 Tax=Capsaspora owczarzaki (strain ATCC 30864) TaxID=595528 RepID=A0A0D2U2D8_CAPO3|nr:hypothetical protein CAOG_009348 [Capsaspora owczarzaki ATCC 30864]